MFKLMSCGLLMLAMGGCSYPNGSGSTNMIDGAYRGRPALTTGGADVCPDTHYGYIELGDQELHFAYLPNVVFDAPISASGELHSVSGPAKLDGKVANDHLIFSVTTPQCHSDYNLSFFWNHS